MRPQAGFDLSNQIGASLLYGNSGGTLERLARFHWKTLQEWCSRKSLAAGFLQLREPQRTLTAGDDDTLRVGAKDFSGLA